MTQTLTFVRLGTRYPGRCPRCGADISRPWEMEAALLYRRADGRYPVCAPCAGARTKSRVGGGVALVREPARTIEVEVTR